PSRPWMAPKTSAQSSTDRQMGPILSMLHDSAMHPARLTRPNVGRSPVVPQTRQGETMLPSVSLPSEKPTSPAAVALAEPADEPDEPILGFQGFFVMRSPYQRSPSASAPSDSFATSTAPASSSRCATVALPSSICSLYGSAPQVVR